MTRFITSLLFKYNNYIRRQFLINGFKKITSLVLTLCFILVNFAFYAEAYFEESNYKKDVEQEVDKYVKALGQQYPFSGSILISQKGKILAKKSYGCSNYELNIPNNPDTKFTIASISKQFVAAAIMIL